MRSCQSVGSKEQNTHTHTDRHTDRQTANKEQASAKRQKRIVKTFLPFTHTHTHTPSLQTWCGRRDRVQSWSCEAGQHSRRALDLTCPLLSTQFERWSGASKSPEQTQTRTSVREKKRQCAYVGMRLRTAHVHTHTHSKRRVASSLCSFVWLFDVCGIEW